MPEQRHPANQFPDLEGTEFDELVASVETHGQIMPVIIDKKTHTVIDGMQRLRACELLKIVPNVVEAEFHDPESACIILNTMRRHLDPATRAVQAAKLVALGLSKRAAAKKAGVARGTLYAKLHEDDLTDSEPEERFRKANDKRKEAGNAPAVAQDETSAPECPETPPEAPASAPDDPLALIPELVEAGKSIRALARAVAACRTDVLAWYSRAGGEHLRNADVDSALEESRKAILASVPHAMCDCTNGGDTAGCNWCRGAGWVTAVVQKRMHDAKASAKKRHGK